MLKPFSAAPKQSNLADAWFGQIFSELNRREPQDISFTSASNQPLYPANVFYHNWLGGPGRRRHACVSPTVLVNAVCRGTVAALEEQERAKRAKHQAACELSGEYAFIPFVVDTFGNLSPDASSLLARLAKQAIYKIGSQTDTAVKRKMAEASIGSHVLNLVRVCTLQ